MKKKTLVQFDKKNLLALCGGAKLIDVTHDRDGCVDDSEELTLLFDNTQEITIWFHSTEKAVVVEAD